MFSFKFFKIIDGASDFYKKNVITQSDSFKELDDDHCKFLSFFHNESEWDYVNEKYITTTERRNLSSVGLRLGIEW